ncbi:DNA replication complex subunit Gins51 [Halobellus rubicundus]|uniref:Gins51 C-terminal domain-containing protein n=1 Tax=Halobellus rubicundus TaxID=2996466 RepID=A0ABD5MD17_9EURY
MDLDELRSVQRTERQKDSLQHLRDSFYEDVADYIADRKAERKRLAQDADDPFSDPDVGRLTDEIETAEDVVEAIYERRVGKVVKLASFAAADMNADTGGLTAEERNLFEDLVARIKGNRETVLDVLAGEGGSSGESPATSPSTPSESAAAGGADPTPADPSRAPESEPQQSASPAADDGASASDGTPPTPDDVLAEAMGGGSASGEAASADPTESEGSDPTVPPDAPPDAVAADAPVVGDEQSDQGPNREPTNGDGRDEASDPPGGPEAVRDGGVAAAADSGGSATDSAGEAAGDDAAATAESASDSDARTGDTERVTLKITEDVGRIFGVDEREYDLASEDVVTLPTTNAGPLIERDAAERLE